MNFETMTDKEMIGALIDNILTYFETNDNLQDFIDEHEDEPMTGKIKELYDENVTKTNKSYKKLMDILKAANERVNKK